MRLSYVCSLLVFGAIGVLALSACGGSEAQGIAPASKAESAADVVRPSQAPAPTETPAPTATSLPAPTATPISAPVAVDYISSSTAREHMGEVGTVRGSVVDYNYRQSAKDRPYILIFDNTGIISQLPFHLRGDLETPITFQVVIRKDYHKNFPPNFAGEYEGHTVCATGTIVDYKGAPAIEAHDPSQLEIDC